MQQIPQSRDTVLDFWRGVSILLVVLSHAISFRLHSFFVSFFDFISRTVSQSDFAVTTITLFSSLFFKIAFESGGLGVATFLVISGYIITKILIEEKERRGTVNLYRFYCRRFFRIMPAYFFYIACVAIFFGLGWVFIPKLPLNCIFFLANINNGACTPLFHHLWSLSVEEQFYFIWPLTVAVLPRAYRISFAMTVYFLSVVLSAAIIPAQYQFINHGIAFAFIAAGSLYALSPYLRGAINASGSLGLILSAVIMINRLTQFMGAGHFIIRLLLPILLSFAMLYFIFNTYKIFRIMESRIFSIIGHLGLISYSLYIWQNIFTGNMRYPAQSPLIWTVLLIPITFISYFLIEKPVVAWARKKYASF